MRTPRFTAGVPARTLGLALVLLTALNPLVVAIHQVGHVVHAAAQAIRTHDDAAHHAHLPIEARDHCALCSHAKSNHALAAGSPRATGDALSSPVAVSPTPGVVPLLLAALPAPRAPPLAS